MGMKRLVMAGMVWCCLFTPSTAGAASTFECINNDRLNRYRPVGSAPSSIQVSIPNLCPGQGVVITASGGVDCDNIIPPSTSPNCSNCGSNQTCVEHQRNDDEKYVWSVSGYVQQVVSITERWGRLNENAFLVANPEMTWNEKPFTIEVRRAEAPHARDLSGGMIIREFHGVVLPPTKIKQRSVRLNRELPISETLIANYFREAGKILREDTDGRTKGHLGQTFEGWKDKHQCVEFVVSNFIYDDNTPLEIVTKEACENEIRRLVPGRVVFSDLLLPGGATGAAICRLNTIIVGIHSPSKPLTLIHEWGHTGGIQHPDEPGKEHHFWNMYGAALYGTETMVTNRLWEPTSYKDQTGIYHECAQGMGLKTWEDLPPNQY